MRLFYLQCFPSSPVVTRIFWSAAPKLQAAQALFYGHLLQLERKIPQFLFKCISSWISAPNDFTLCCDAKNPPVTPPENPETAAFGTSFSELQELPQCLSTNNKKILSFG